MNKVKPVVYNEKFTIKLDEPLIPASVISRLLGIPVWTLKRIDKEKVVSPFRKKDKMRLYSREELDKLKYIWYLIKDKKVKITGLKAILEIEERSHSKG